jgi:hypothetical protein
MWICLNDAFLSIVRDRGVAGNLLVRARRPGDIQALFPEAVVRVGAGTDYRYRTSLPASEVAEAVARRLREIRYDNFKASVSDADLHDAYVAVWTAMRRM